MRFDSNLFNHSLWQIDPFGLAGFYSLPDQLASDHAPPFAGAPFATQTVLYAPDGGSAARAGSKGGGGNGGGTTPSPPPPPSGLVINIAWDASVQSAPTGFTTAVTAAAQYLESHFSDPVTINISVGYGEVNGTTLGSGTLGASSSYLSSVSYAGLTSALATDASSATDSAALASLPASSPVAGTLWTTTAQAKALGLTAATSTATDGFIGFSSTLPFTYDSSAGVPVGSYDFNGVALHEMTEVMGRMLLTGATVGSTANSYDLMDLFHYASPGVRTFSASTPGYVSADGGVTSLGTLNTAAGGDAGDWASAMGYDSFDAFSNSGVVNPITTADLSVLDLLGWNLPPVSTPTGVTLAPVTAALAGAQSTSGLTAGAPLVTAAQTGGAAGDSYAYTLGGADAAAFTLTTATNAASLAVGASGLAGQAGGRAYALSITATDTTSGVSAAPSPLDVIVASGGADSVSVATLSSALGSATPGFVYGLAGADTLNGSGMTGPLWLDGGAGADTMTGGSGPTTYLYGATSDSGSAASDVITNFHAAADLINLTGLGVSLKLAGAIRKSNLAADSIGWKSSGGNTFVYVNTSGGTQSLGATDMRIELLGSISLGSGNFVHL